MKRVLVGVIVIVLIFCMVGCSSAEDFIGRWDIYGYENDGVLEPVSENADYYMDVNDDGTLAIHMNFMELTSIQNGTYSIKDGKMFLSLESEENGDKVYVGELADDNLTITFEEDYKMCLERH